MHVPSSVRRPLVALTAVGCLAATRAAGGATAPTVRQDSVARLAWLGGCWELRSGARVTQEQWMAPSGGLMMGMSRTVVRDTAREFESLRIETRQGVATYVAIPSRQSETAFPATMVSDTAVVFENAAHDFPQRIRYRRVNADSIVARIEGTVQGRARGIDFPMRRGSCR